MQRNTTTFFGELRTGDRFYMAGDKQKIAYQVTIKADKKSGCFNYIDEHGKKCWIHDREVLADKPVVFLRHTQPAAGEEWKLSELGNGDVFHLQDDIITEYLVIKNKVKTIFLNISTDEELKGLPVDSKVIFVRTI